VTAEQVSAGEGGLAFGPDSDGEMIHEGCRDAYDERMIEEIGGRGVLRAALDPNYHTGFDQLAEKADDYRDARGL
jgi:hypothetical protein